jgi:hypothetical protein
MSRREKRLERVLAFRTCPFCEHDIATGEGERACHHYECPYLPEELDVRCPDCLYNFFAEDGNPACGDPPDCEFALEVAPVRVATLRAWTEQQAVGGSSER